MEAASPDVMDRTTRSLAAAAGAAVLLPVLVLGLGAPLWLAALGAAGVLAAGVFWPGARLRPLPPPARAALEDAEPALRRLDEAAEHTRHRVVAAHVRAVAQHVRTIDDHVRANPASLGELHRVFTYYAPRAAAIAEAYRLLEDDHANPRLAQMEHMLARLDAALGESARRCAEDALAPLDVELRLMDAALKEDMEK
jgi:hypothetical protein